VSFGSWSAELARPGGPDGAWVSAVTASALAIAVARRRVILAEDDKRGDLAVLGLGYAGDADAHRGGDLLLAQA
jgi:hypothetical protein